jgi:hypothetical protein
MEQQQIEHNNDSMTILQPAQKQSALLGWLAEQVTILAEAMGESMTPARLKIYAGDLADIERPQMEIAFSRARCELRFFPKICELRELAGEGEKQQADAEARAAWDQLIQFVGKFVSNDIYGNYGPEHGWHAKSFPRLSDRILDCVRRTGGWKTYACMSNDDFPFQQKRFFEEFLAWEAVQHVPLDRLLKTQDVLALGSPKHSSEPAAHERAKAARIVDVCLKSVPAPVPMTDAQLLDRREMLRQQAAFVRRTYSARHKGECSSLAPGQVHAVDASWA